MGTITKRQIDLICQQTWELLESHKDDRDKLYLSALNPNTLTYQEGHLITQGAAKEYIRTWVMESLEKHEKVYLYTCRDNAEIAIEDIDELKADFNESGNFEETWEDHLDYLNKGQAVPEELRGILYIFFD